MGAVLQNRAGSGLETVRGLFDAIGAAQDVDAAAAATASLIRAAVGGDAVLTLVRPDAAGRLRVVRRDGEMPGGGRDRLARRRVVFETSRPDRVHPRGHVDLSVGMFPLVSRGDRVGVLEVVASELAMDTAWETLEVAANQLAIALGNIAKQAELHRELESLERASSLGTDLVRARTPEAAVRVAVRFVSERFGVPVAGWCVEADGGLHLTAVRGLGTRKRRELREAQSRLPGWGSLRPTTRLAVRRRFGGIVGVEHVAVLDAGDALLLAGNPRQPIETSLEVVGSLLTEVLRLLSAAALAEQRKEQLDMGIAWTMHELRGPLLGVRAVLDLLLQRRHADPRELRVLRSSLRELDQLVDTAEDLLSWAVGARPLRRRMTDVVRIVEEAVESCRLERGEDGVLLLTPHEAFARIDATNVRAAVMNLLRNALAYADPGTKVEVKVEEEGDHLTLSVKDEGPAIPPAERLAIFDPFVRGRVSGRARNGSGLGLFIARRVVEAHGGRIWVDSDRHGATFYIVLPVEERGERRFAS